MKYICLPIIVLMAVFILVACSHRDRSRVNPQRHGQLKKEAYYAPLPPESTQSISTALTLVAKNPKSSDAHFALGMAYYKERQYAKSAEELEKAIRISPDNVNVE